MQACDIYLCESCDLTFETGNLQIKHRYKDHSVIGSITIDSVDGIKLPCLQTSEGLLKCPSSDCPNYEKLHHSMFVKHLLKHKMKLMVTKHAATSNPESYRLHKMVKVMRNYTEDKHHLFSLVAPHSVATVVTDIFQINWFSVRNKIGKIAKIFVKIEDPENWGVI
jgi:hypothetical protein